MRESTIILPVDCGETAHRLLKLYLSRRFDGFTAVEADGGWINPFDELVEERVMVYTVAMAPTLKNITYLLDYAAALAKGNDQDCIYVRLPFGHVFLIDADGRDVS